jgi:hypothetical protein
MLRNAAAKPHAQPSRPSLSSGPQASTAPGPSGPLAPPQRGGAAEEDAERRECMVLPSAGQQLMVRPTGGAAAEAPTWVVVVLRCAASDTLPSPPLSPSFSHSLTIIRAAPTLPAPTLRGQALILQHPAAPRLGAHAVLTHHVPGETGRAGARGTSGGARYECSGVGAPAARRD